MFIGDTSLLNVSDWGRGFLFHRRQAIALFLERQSEVQYAEEWLTLLDDRATPIDACHIIIVHDSIVHSDVV